MTHEDLQKEINSLIQKIEQLKQDICISDGAIQAFRYMQAQLDKPQVEVDEVPVDVSGVPVDVS